jgi:hypothetical protein
MPPQWSGGSPTPSAYPATFPAQSSVPPVRPDADGFALWSHTAVLRRPIRVRVTGWSMIASSWGGLPYMTNTPPDLDVHSASSDEQGVYQYRLGGRHYDHPVSIRRNWSPKCWRRSGTTPTGDFWTAPAPTRSAC